MKQFYKIFLLLLSNLSFTKSFGIDIANLPHLYPDTATSLVKFSTSILPQFDSIGHYVLHTNEVLINKVLELNINPYFKKKLILEVIDLSRQGDEMGGKILENYYKFIDFLL